MVIVKYGFILYGMIHVIVVVKLYDIVTLPLVSFHSPILIAF